MSGDDPVDAYLAELRAKLGRRWRRRRLSWEAEGHLREAVARRVATGTTPAQAAAEAIACFGTALEVASALDWAQPAWRRRGRGRVAAAAFAVVMAAIAIAVVFVAGPGGQTAGTEHGAASPAPPVAENPVRGKEVANGAVDELSWSAAAYQSDRGVCIDIVFSGSTSLVGGGCGFGVPDARTVGVGRTYLADPNRTWIFGPATSSTDTVSLGLDDGRALSVKTAELPATEAREGLSVYVTSIPGNVSVTSVEGRDGNGGSLGRIVAELP